jgi:hypothetical protein
MLLLMPLWIMMALRPLEKRKYPSITPLPITHDLCPKVIIGLGTSCQRAIINSAGVGEELSGAVA